MSSTESRIVIALLSLMLVLGITGDFMWYQYHEKVRQTEYIYPPADLEKLFLKGEYKNLLAAVSEHEAEYPADPNVFFYRGMALYHLEQYEDAIRNFEESIVISPAFRDQSYLWIEACQGLKAEAEGNENLPEALREDAPGE